MRTPAAGLHGVCRQPRWTTRPTGQAFTLAQSLSVATQWLKYHVQPQILHVRKEGPAEDLKEKHGSFKTHALLILRPRSRGQMVDRRSAVHMGHWAM